MESFERTLGPKTIFFRIWATSIPKKGMIGIVHGHGEHSGRYEHVAKFFNDHGYHVMAFDLPGHGKSGGKRGVIESVDELMNSISMLLSEMNQLDPNLPKFLYGQSMGGTLLSNFLLRKKPDLKGAILSSPWFKLALKPPAVKLFIGNLMRKIYPAWTETSILNPADLSRDPQVGIDYQSDPLVHKKISAGLFFSILEAADYAIYEAGKIKVPILAMHGTADKIISISGTQSFANHAGILCSFHPWQDCRHELHNETCKEKVLQFVLDWMEKL